MKIATFNVNGVNARLAVLLRWLAEAAPDVVCLHIGRPTPRSQPSSSKQIVPMGTFCRRPGR